MEHSEPLLFLRRYEACDEKSYFELNQRIAHVLDLYWDQDRKAYCRVDERGDIEGVVAIGDLNEASVCSAELRAIQQYMLVTRQLMIRLFDIPLQSPLPTYQGEDDRGKLVNRPDLGIYGRWVTDGLGGPAGYFRGFQVIRVQQDEENRLIRGLLGRPEDGEKFESFIINDWRNRTVREWSASPSGLSSYFMASDQPFSMSPAYFRAEVLQRYKQDRDRYRIAHSSIECRGGWYLRRYGLNDAGQVFAYIGDLSKLPYAEQMYWKAFNEWPRAGLPADVIRTDFEGVWPESLDPQEDLLYLLRHFPKVAYHSESRDVWSQPSKESEFRLNYVVTDSRKEWEDEILQLTKVVIEGLSKKMLRRIADYRDCDDSSIGTILLLRRCLETNPASQSKAAEICDPLKSLWDTRSSVGSAHRGSGKAIGDVRANYRDHVTAVHDAMQQLAQQIDAGVLDCPLSIGA